MINIYYVPFVSTCLTCLCSLRAYVPLKDVNDVVLVSLLLMLNTFHTLF